MFCSLPSSPSAARAASSRTTPAKTGAYADEDEDGFQGIDGDCDDQDPGVFPGAAELAGDGVDNNCDGLDGSAESLQDEAVFTLTGEELRPSLGSRVAVVRDMDGDGHAELVMTQQLVGLENSAEELTEQVVIVPGPLDTTTTS
ncbi:MAG: putative metal-binding motif-containing protein [Deltaproteobacteria bacterium]|nr:putative metal-binding motif-containing protein [Deltaproteobacteria bacterium]